MTLRYSVRHFPTDEEISSIKQAYYSNRKLQSWSKKGAAIIGWPEETNWGAGVVREGEVLASSGDERGGGFEGGRFDGKVRGAPGVRGHDGSIRLRAGLRRLLRRYRQRLREAVAEDLHQQRIDLLEAEHLRELHVLRNHSANLLKQCTE